MWRLWSLVAVIPACNAGSCTSSPQCAVEASQASSMAQVKMSMLQSLHGASLAEEGSVERSHELVMELAQKVAAHNLTLSEDESAALDAIKAMVEAMINTTSITHIEDQGEVDRARDLTKSCADDAKDLLDGNVKDLNRTMEGHRGAHAGCRNAEVTKRNNMTAACSLYNMYRQTNSLAEPPTTMGQFITDDYVKTSDADELKDMEGCLEEVNTWLNPLYSLYDDCAQNKDAHTDQTRNCNIKQGTFEASYCSYASKLDSTCDEQIRCRNRELKNRLTTHAAIKISEAARKSDYEAGSKIVCLFKVFEAENKDKKVQLQTCKDLDVDVSGLDIEYREIPDATDCTKEQDRPCADSWLSREYAQWPDTTMAYCHACITAGQEEPQKMCAGSTAVGASNWIQYGRGKNKKGVYMDVDINRCGFQEVPTIVTSLGGHSNIHTTGSSEIYSLTATGFRVVISTTSTPSQANENQWHINWVAQVSGSCAGTTAKGTTDWKAENEHNGGVPYVYLDVDTSGCQIDSPALITSLSGQSQHWRFKGATELYSVDDSGFRMYLSRSDEAMTPALANTHSWHVNWIHHLHGRQVYTNGMDCAGETALTDWKKAGDFLYLDVDTSRCGFDSVPVYVSTMKGDSNHWISTGSSEIQGAHAKGFRVYISRGTTTPQQASDWKWQLMWLASTPKEV